VVPVVYNSNGYDSVEALRQIRGLVDISLPDLKYLDNGLGERFSATGDYADIVPGVLAEMLDQVGHLEMDADGITVRGLLVRHLVLPDCVGNTRSCLDLQAGLSRDTFFSIMSQYSPRYKAGDLPGLNRALTEYEYDAVVEHALDLGLERAFVQELESQEHHLPDFARESPFDPAAEFPGADHHPERARSAAAPNGSSRSPMSLADLIPTLQLSIGPVILISGVGLILLSMTNRFGRVIDRSRLLSQDLRGAADADRARILAELRILSRRARLVRAGIALAALSVFLAALMIISLFLGALLQLRMAEIIVTLFSLCMLSLILSLLMFLFDTNLSLKALWLEIPPEGRRDA
ncbi:MAG: DUF2721 domain-containing protein, partial [bacterium]